MARYCLVIICAVLTLCELIESLSDTERISRMEELLETQQKKIDSLSKTLNEQRENMVTKQKLINEFSDIVRHNSKKTKLQREEITELTKTIHQQSNEISVLKSKVEYVEKLTKKIPETISWMSTYRQNYVADKENSGVNSNEKSQRVDRRELYNDNENTVTNRSSKNGNERRLLIGNDNSNRKVGFYAYIKQNEAIGYHKVMVFNVVETNIGSGYNNHSGIFNAPISGLYAFSCTLYPSNGGIGNFHLVHNDKEVSTMFTDYDDSSWDLSASGVTIVLSLQQRDDVYLRSGTKDVFQNSGSIEGSHYAKSSFSGWLISE